MLKKVAIITRTKNRVILLRRAIESVLGQTEEDWVHVIVNDGGNPEPVEQLLSEYTEQYADRLIVVHNPESLGMEGASNKGIKASDSEYVVIHDDDDSWEPAFLERCVQELSLVSFPSVKGVVTHTTQVFEKVTEDGAEEEYRRDFDPWLVSVSLPEISEINKFMPISFLFERSVFDEIGYYDDSLPVIGDWEFNIRFLMKYDIVVVKENLANYHIRTNKVGDYSNTVTAGNDAHLFYRDMIVNKFIRQDIADGKLTHGMLMAYGDYFHRIGRNTWRLVQVVERLKSFAPLVWLRKVLRA